MRQPIPLAALAVGVAFAVAPASAGAAGCPTGIPMYSLLDNTWHSDGRGPDDGPMTWFTYAQTPPADPGNPLSGKPWFVDCNWDESWIGSRKVVDWNPRRHRYVRATRQSPRVSALISRFIATKPIAKWFGPSAKRTASGRRLNPNTRTSMYLAVSAYLRRTAVQAPGAIRFMILRRLESGNCRAYRKPDQAVFGRRVHRQLVDGFAAAVRDAARQGFGGPILVVIEPDIMASITCTLETISSGGARSAFLRTREAEIRYAISRIGALPDSTVYLDAGASDYTGWRQLSKYMTAVMRNNPPIRGFSLDVTHYDWTRDNLVYGERLARRLSSTLHRPIHFVVSTSRSGGGNIQRRYVGRGYDSGCNIPNAGLGPEPTTDTGNRYADAFLWLLDPGFSDGNCKSGRLSYRTRNVEWSQTLALRVIRQRCQTGSRCLGPSHVTLFE